MLNLIAKAGIRQDYTMLGILEFRVENNLQQDSGRYE